jgi:ATP-binding cassette, subfamily B, bacterial
MTATVAVQTLEEDDSEKPVGAIATLRRAAALVPGFSKGLVTTTTMAGFGALGRLVLPLLLQQVFDRAISTVNGKTTVDLALAGQLCAIAFVATIAAEAATRVAAYRLGSWSEWLMAELRKRCMDRFVDMSLDQHAAQKKGVLVARVTTDVESIARFFEWGAISWLVNSVVVIVLSAFLLAVDLRLGLIALLVASPVIVVISRMQRHLRNAFAAVRHHVGTYLGQASELVGGAAVIRAYGAQEIMRSATTASIDNRRRSTVKASTIGALLFPMGELFATAAVSSVVLVGVGIGSKGGLTEGAVVAAIFATIRLLDPVAEISENIDYTQSAIAGLSRVLDVMDLPVEIDPHPTGSQPLPAGPLAVVLDAVSYAYPARPDETTMPGPLGNETTGPGRSGMTWALQDVSIDVPAGTSLALVGATGSGKSTTARLIGRLADPQMGRVLLGGVDIKAIDDVELRSRVQVVPQEPFLFDTTIGSNLRLGHSTATDAEILAAMDRLGLADWLDSLPEGLNTKVGERGSELSAGERQLVALLRAEVIGPDVLVLDEATSSVDAAMEARLAAATHELGRGRTMIVIAHRISTAARADRIAVIDHGRVVEMGSHDELTASDGPYARLAASFSDATRPN